MWWEAHDRISEVYFSTLPLRWSQLELRELGDPGAVYGDSSIWVLVAQESRRPCNTRSLQGFLPNVAARLNLSLFRKRQQKIPAGVSSLSTST